MSPLNNSTKEINFKQVRSYYYYPKREERRNRRKEEASRFRNEFFVRKIRPGQESKPRSNDSVTGALSQPGWQMHLLSQQIPCLRLMTNHRYSGDEI